MALQLFQLLISLRILTGRSQESCHINRSLPLKSDFTFVLSCHIKRFINFLFQLNMAGEHDLKVVCLFLYKYLRQISKPVCFEQQMFNKLPNTGDIHKTFVKKKNVLLDFNVNRINT